MFIPRHLLAGVLITLLFLGSDHVHADIAVISPSRDNTLIEDLAGARSNGSGPSFFAGNISQGSTRRAVCFFDLASYIPAGSLINAVELHLHVSGSGSAGVQMVDLHRLLADWGEGASSASGGSGAASAPGDATWIHTFYADQFWTTPGGDFDPAVSASTAVGESGFFMWSGTGAVDDVQGWLDNPAANFGWLLRGNESEAGTVRRFDSRENPDETVWPTLVVDYTPGATQVQSATWGRVKSQYRSGGHR